MHSIAVLYISDKSYYLKAIFSSKSLHEYYRSVLVPLILSVVTFIYWPPRSCIPTTQLVALKGGVMCLQEYSVACDTSHSEFVIVIDKFNFIGAEGCPVFENPRFAMEEELIRASLDNMRRYNSHLLSSPRRNLPFATKDETSQPLTSSRFWAYAFSLFMVFFCVHRMKFRKISSCGRSQVRLLYQWSVQFSYWMFSGIFIFCCRSSLQSSRTMMFLLQQRRRFLYAP